MSLQEFRFISRETAKEFSRATALHEPMNSAHEAYAVILEELDEFWEEVRKKESERNFGTMRKELIQVATMAIRAIYDLKLPRPKDTTDDK